MAPLPLHFSLHLLALYAKTSGRVGEADDDGPHALSEHSGRIDLILGPMFAGKTSELLRRVEEHEVNMSRHSNISAAQHARCSQMLACMLTGDAHWQAAGWRVAVVKSTVDTRYHATKVVSHDGMSKVWPCCQPSMPRLHAPRLDFLAKSFSV